MTRAVELVHSRSFPAGVKRAFDEVLVFELTRLFDRRYAAIPPIKAVRGQTGPWGTPGQTRTIVLSGGGSMREELREVVPAKRFGYHLSEITGPMKALVRTVEGTWEFEKAGTGVRITWRWTVHPRGRLGALAMPAFARMWQGSARLAFDNLERLLVH
jgi:polyketide cyclase/dehydrase/lipid transport protein